MNTHTHSPDRSLEHPVEHPYLLVISVFLASLILGLVPIAISSNLATSSNPDSAPLVLGEAGLWNAVGR